MDFSDEHYVRIYSRDTKTWLRWGWEGQAVFMFVVRKLDKAGVLDEIDDQIEDVALITGLPVDVVRVGLPKVLQSGTFELSGNKLVCPKYLDANTARKSDKLRAQESRERRALTARHGASHGVTARHTASHDDSNRDEASQNVMGESQNVTDSHGASHGVTPASLNADQRSADQRSADQRSATHPQPPSDLKFTNLESAIELPIVERSKRLTENPHQAEWVSPQSWPEVTSLHRRICDSMGWQFVEFRKPVKSVMTLVEVLATFTPEQIDVALRAAPTDRWLTEGRKGIGCFTPSVVANLLNADRAPAPAPAKPKTPEEIIAERRSAALARELGLA